MEQLAPQIITTLFGLLTFLLTSLCLFQFANYFLEKRHSVIVPTSSMSKVLLGILFMGVGFQLYSIIDSFYSSITLLLRSGNGSVWDSNLLYSLVVFAAIFIIINMISLALSYYGCKLIFGNDAIDIEFNQDNVWTGFIMGALFIGISLILLSFEVSLIEFYHINATPTSIG